MAFLKLIDIQSLLVALPGRKMKQETPTLDKFSACKEKESNIEEESNIPLFEHLIEGR